MKKIVMFTTALALVGSGAAIAGTKHAKPMHKPAAKEAPAAKAAPAKPAPAK